MMRFLWRLLTIVLSVAFLGLVLIITPAGLKLSISLTNQFSDSVHIDTKNVSGTLLGPIHIDSIIITQDNNQFQVTNLTLRWEVEKLLLGQLRVQQLTADQAHLFFGEKTPSSSSSDSFVPTSIQELLVNKIVIVSPLRAQPIVLTHSHGSALLHKNSVAIEARTNVELPGIQRANIHLTGSMKHYRFSVNLFGDHTQTSLTGSGSRKQLIAEIKPSKLLGGEISGKIHVTWEPTWQWKTVLSLDGVHLNEWDSLLPAISSARLASHGYLDPDKHPHLDYDAHVVSNLIDLTSKGHIGDTNHFTWALKASGLNALMQSWPSGHIDTSGSWNDGHTKGSIKASHLSWKGNVFGDLDASWDTVTSPFYINHLHLKATDFSYSLLALKKADVSIEGDKTHAHISGSIFPDFPRWDLSHGDFALDAKRDNGNHWKGRWSYFNLNGPHGLWTLGAHPLVSISEKGIKQPHMCWTLKHRALCFHWSWLDSHWELHFKGQNLPLDTWLSLSLPHIQPKGSNHLIMNIAGDENKPVLADAELTLSDDLLEFPSPYRRIAFTNAHFKSTLTNKAWTIDGSSKLEEKGHLSVHSVVDRTPGKTWGSCPLHASITLDSHNFSPLLHLIPMLRLTHNRLSMHSLITGSIGQPIINGHLSLMDGSATLPSLGTDLKGLSLETHWKDNHINYKLFSTQSPSALSINGTGELDTNAWRFSTQAKIHGKHLLLFNQPDYLVYADPDIQASFVDHNWLLSGNLTVSDTTLKPTSLTGSHAVPSDVTIIRTGKKEEEHEHLGLNVQLKIDHNVKIDTTIFKATLGGQVRLTKEPGLHPFLGNGSISVSDGRVDILTNHYFVDDAYLSYLDTPITEPTLNVKIFRLIKAPHLRRHKKPRSVGLHITGPLKYPTILPYSSDPSLSNNDIVSYFAFDRPSDRGQPIHVATLLNALAELPNNGGNLDPKTRSMLIKQAIGFSELGEQSGASLANTGAPISGNDDAFVVGRYLSPNIYLRYTRGISSAYSIYQIRYSLSPSLAIQTESGSLGNGGDLLYSFTSLLHPKTSALTK